MNGKEQLWDSGEATGRAVPANRQCLSPEATENKKDRIQVLGKIKCNCYRLHLLECWFLALEKKENYSKTHLHITMLIKFSSYPAFFVLFFFFCLYSFGAVAIFSLMTNTALMRKHHCFGVGLGVDTSWDLSRDCRSGCNEQTLPYD